MDAARHVLPVSACNLTELERRYFWFRHHLSRMRDELTQAYQNMNHETAFLEPEFEKLALHIKEFQSKLDFDATLQKDHAALHDAVPNPEEGLDTWISGSNTDPP
jgi:hypothetical protein